MRITLGGQYWQRRLVNRLAMNGEQLDGDCLFDERMIRIVRGQSPGDEFETDVHEAIHAQCPWMREWMVERMALELRGLIFDKLGYRKPNRSSKTQKPKRSHNGNRTTR